MARSRSCSEGTRSWGKTLRHSAARRPPCASPAKPATRRGTCPSRCRAPPCRILRDAPRLPLSIAIGSPREESDESGLHAVISTGLCSGLTTLRARKSRIKEPISATSFMDLSPTFDGESVLPRRGHSRVVVCSSCPSLSLVSIRACAGRLPWIRTIGHDSRTLEGFAEFVAGSRPRRSRRGRLSRALEVDADASARSRVCSDPSLAVLDAGEHGRDSWLLSIP
jgi:hypothetical protein